MTDKQKPPEDGTCAGKAISGAMHFFSTDLLQGCSYFAAEAERARDHEERRFCATACIFFGASVIETKVNEWISISTNIADTEIPQEFWKTLESSQKNLRLDEKWNLITSVSGGTLWDSGKEPFQSYSMILALRNELVHYKGQFLGKDEAPSKKIKELLTKFRVQSKATSVEADTSTWVADLLNEPTLARWIADKVNCFHSDAYKLLLGDR